MLRELSRAEQEARSRGYSNEDLNEIKFALVAFLDETALGCGNPIFADWRRLTVQAQMYGTHQAGEVFFQHLQKTLNRSDSRETADLLEVYYLCLLLGFKGRYAAGGNLRSVMSMVQEKIARIRGRSVTLSPRGALPADAVRLVETDHWLKPLTIAAVSIIVLATAIFTVFKIVLVSGASELSNLATQFAK
jgi:type VI secretion system protein ImpK